MGASLGISGDYVLQVSILELLFHFTTQKERNILALSCFGKFDLSDQFLCIREDVFDIVRKE